jgi:cysteine desulfurase/selenocysteine lyase
MQGIRAQAEEKESSSFDAWKVRKDFPILERKVHGKPLIYLDNAATTQKPRSVVSAMERYYTEENSNIHRGVHYLSEQATQAFEDARDRVRAFLNARESREVIFVRGATEAINLVAQSYGRKFLREGDEIILSIMEHHSNIVPWQILREQTGICLRVAPIDDSGELCLEEFEQLLSDKTRLVSVVHLSNALGTVNPMKQIVAMAHEREIPVLVDGAQAAAHLSTDVQDLDCDFYAFSGHKLYGPTGIGVLYGRAALLEAMAPYQGGGDMISSVTFEKTLYNVLPYKFEAGTPHIAGAIGLGAAIGYVTEIGLDAIHLYEEELLSYATRALSTVPGVRIIGTAREKAAVLSFVLDGVHAHDIGTILDRDGIAIRTGHHCTMPLMQRLGLPATARASVGMYNTKEEIEELVRSLHEVIRVFH